MRIGLTLLNIRNTIDFALRSRLRWSRKIKPTFPTPERDLKLQREFQEFFSLFDWKNELERLPKPLTVADVGARNFAFAPVIDRVFAEQELEIELHGIEIDAYRRLTDFRTRKDYGDFYARSARKAEFHPIDFLKWQRPLHLALVLNPFVSEEPTLAWGLPLSMLKPDALFHHAFHLLRPQKGKMLLTCPSPEEFAIALEHAQAVGFKPGHRKTWHPQGVSVQQKPRYGILLHSALF